MILDVCVLATVMDGLRLGFKVFLILNATRPVNQTKGAAAVEQMKNAGVMVIGQGVVSEKEDKELKPDTDVSQSTELPVCTKAPEWAEHQRYTDTDEPCDNGRSGKM